MNKNALIVRLAVAILIASIIIGIISASFFYRFTYANELEFSKKQLSQLELTISATASISAYLSDVELASFLNGLIIDKRGKKDGPERQAEEELSNNAIFNKLKIALALKADEVTTILELADLSLGKYELSAFFRNVNHKHYRECSDDVLSTFLKGLKIQSQQ